MNEQFLHYAFPIMIVLAFVNFLWAWMLTAVAPPRPAEEHRISGQANPEWRALDAGPEGIRINLIEKVNQQTEAVQ
ncbi:MAG: hypothetical protein HY282_00595 [Nitrospirae bacterium]|nr:hypothetical protein [Candidatus Manganitrophaceae bacterium]